MGGIIFVQLDQIRSLQRPSDATVVLLPLAFAHAGRFDTFGA